MVHIAIEEQRVPQYNASFDVGGMDERHKAEKIIADFATAFSLDMDEAEESVPENSWSAGMTIAFSLGASLALWALLSAVFYLV